MKLQWIDFFCAYNGAYAFCQKGKILKLNIKSNCFFNTHTHNSGKWFWSFYIFCFQSDTLVCLDHGFPTFFCSHTPKHKNIIPLRVLRSNHCSILHLEFFLRFLTYPQVVNRWFRLKLYLAVINCF